MEFFDDQVLIASQKKIIMGNDSNSENLIQKLQRLYFKLKQFIWISSLKQIIDQTVQQLIFKRKKKFIFIFCVLIYLIYGWITHSQLAGEKQNYTNIEGKTIIITGASSGIGLEAAREFAKLKANVIFGCKDQEKTLKIIKEIQMETLNENLFFISVNLDDPTSISDFSNKIKKRFNQIDILINNAGMADFDQSFINKVDRIFSVNQLGWVQLTNELIDSFSSEGRIINVVSHMYNWIQEQIDIYQAFQGKFAQRYATSQYFKVSSSLYLQKLINQKNKEIKVALIAPGAVETNIFEKSLVNHPFYLFILGILKFIMRPFLLTPNEACWTYLYVALQPYNELIAGGLYNFGKLGKVDQRVMELDQGQEIYEESLVLIQDNYLHIKWDKIFLQYEQLKLNNKTCWPECLGMSVYEAQNIIQEDYPDANIKVQAHYRITKNYRIDRVRVIYNKDEGIVASIPCIG